MSSAEHPVSCAPPNIAVQWNWERGIDTTLYLQCFEILDLLSWALHLDGEGTDGGNDVQWVIEHAVLQKGGIKLPNVGGGVNVGYLRDGREDQGDREIDHMCEARKAIWVGTEWVDVTTMEEVFHDVGHFVVWGGIVSSETE